MTFLWPDLLWLSLAAPALVASYVLLLRRRKKAALRYASLALVREALGPGPGFGATCRRSCSCWRSS